MREHSVTTKFKNGWIDKFSVMGHINEFKYNIKTKEEKFLPCFIKL